MPRGGGELRCPAGCGRAPWARRADGLLVLGLPPRRRAEGASRAPRAARGAKGASAAAWRVRGVGVRRDVRGACGRGRARGVRAGPAAVRGPRRGAARRAARRRAQRAEGGVAHAAGGQRRREEHAGTARRGGAARRRMPRSLRRGLDVLEPGTFFRLSDQVWWDESGVVAYRPCPRCEVLILQYVPGCRGVEKGFSAASVLGRPRLLAAPTCACASACMR